MIKGNMIEDGALAKSKLPNIGNSEMRLERPIRPHGRTVCWATVTAAT